MRRLAVAVLLFLFIISSAVPGAASPTSGTLDYSPLASENPGGQVENAHYDLFTQSLAIRADPFKHLVADLNNDSRPDVAVIYENSPTLDIFFGDANFHYSTLDRTTRTMANHITDIAIGDMNNDLLVDLVVSLNSTSNNVVILNQVGGFSLPGLAFTTSLRPFGIALNDFDGDGYLDVATLISTVPPTYNSGFEIHFYSESYGTKALATYLHTPPLNFQKPRLFTAGDFNYDGRIDLVIGDRDVGRVVGFLNGNDNGLVWSSYYSFDISGPTSIVLQQLDGTGVPELVVGADLAQRVQIRRFSGSSFSLHTEMLNEPGITSLAFMDRNGDARLDMVKASTQYHNLTVFSASPSLTYGYASSISFPVPLEPSHVTVADMNADQRDDIVLISRTSTGAGSLTIYYQNPTTISNANDNQLVKDVRPDIVAMGDFNGDGSKEIAVYDAVQNIIRFLKEGDSYIHQRLAPDNVTAMTAVDLDIDGYDDLVMAVADPSGLAIWYGGASFMTGGGTTASITSGLAQAYDVTIGDLNNDGLTDLAVSGEGGIDVFWASSTVPRFESSRHQLLAMPGSVLTSITAGSFDSNVDSLIDIAVLNQTASRVDIYYQQTGATKFLHGSTQRLSVLPGSYQVGSADMNGDGAEDILVSTVDDVNLYLQTSTFAHGFSDSQDVYVLDVPEEVAAFSTGDLNDDGKMELAVATSGSTVLAYKFNFPSFQMITRQTAGASHMQLLVDDANGDLKDDLVAYSIPSRCVSFYYQNNFAPVAAGEVEGSGHLEGVPVWFNAYGSTDNYSDQDRLSYAWDFGDGSMGSGIRTSHVFLGDGTYNVVLKVSDPSGAWDEAVIPVIIGDQSPTANFTFQEDPAPIEGIAVQFQDLSTSPADQIVSWIWDFGDGRWSNRTSNEPVLHTYSWDGTFMVTLTVIDEDGSQDSLSLNITVEDSSPIADFSASSYTPIEGQPVTFSDLSVPAADDIVNWYWDMGDGTLYNRTSGGSFQHTYVYNGSYRITLVVRDKDGSEDNVSKQIVVQNSFPVAGFSLSVISPEEGQSVTFIDTTIEINPIVKWSWDLGDGTLIERSDNSSVLHTYADNGTYYAKLTVSDVDGDVNTFTRTVVVKDTSPVVSRLYTVDGASSYKEWDVVVFRVIASAQYDEIVRYQWSFETLAFRADSETDFNSTSHRYNSSGTYRVAVRVWDSDSYTERIIQITITDPAPVPDFTISTNVNDRMVIFSAALTLDTENDQDWLRYRWFFGDGQQTDWSHSFVTNHTYQQDGVYSVRLEVRDDHNPSVIKTRNVTIDLLPPVISMDDPVLKADVGKPILIKVNVTDRVGIGSVLLEYTIGNITRTVVMTHEGGGIYFAQIPAQNRTMELTYRIVAEDMAGHSASTEEFTMVLEYEDPSLFIYTSLVLLIAFLIIIIYLFLSRPIVDEVFVMYHDGTLLAHQTRRLKPGMDDEILGGMLIALQNFVRDSFKDENLTVLRRMDFGERKLLVERKDDFFIAVVLSGKRAGNAAQRMLKVLDNIDEGYAPVLKEWDGDLEKVRGIREETKPMFQRANPLDRLKSKEGEDDSI